MRYQSVWPLSERAISELNSPACLPSSVAARASFPGPYPLKGFDQDRRTRLSQSLEQSAIQLVSQTQTELVAKTEDGYLVRLPTGQQLPFDGVLTATGRLPHTEKLDLERLGLQLADKVAIPLSHHSVTGLSRVH